MDLVLASTSAGRRALLERLGVPFSCVAPGVDEAPLHASEPDPAQLAQRLAAAKAEAVAALHPEAVVIGGDQVAALEDEVLHQPGSPERAREQLRRLSGRTHVLHTATCIQHPGGAVTWLEAPRMTMRELTDAEIARSVERDDPRWCAGAYKLERSGIALFERIEAVDWNAVVGLPLLRLVRELRALGMPVP